MKFPPASILIVLLLAPIAHAAQFEVTGNLTCTDGTTGPKLVNEKLSTPQMIEAALGGGDGKLYALVYDGNFDIDIVQRCNGDPVRSFVADGGRGTNYQIPVPPGDTRKYVAVYDGALGDWFGATGAAGRMTCAFKGKSAIGSDELLIASGSCKFTAAIDFRGVCSFGGKIGKPFKTGGLCPK